MQQKNKISVVIPVYSESWRTIKDCVNSLCQQTFKPLEILIINNAAGNETVSRLGKLRNKISILKIITNKTNAGVAIGRNMGVKFANKKADYIFFFDHDMVADRQMLEELLKVAERDKKIGVVTPKIYYWTNKKRIWAAGTGMNLWTGQVLFRGGKDVGQYEKIEEVQVAPAAMLVKKEVIDKIKGFDNRYFATYEDTDFCFRARRKGFKTYYAPKAVAYHMLSTDSKDEASRLLTRSYWVGRNRVLFMKDFSKSFFIFSLFIPVYAAYYLLIAIKSSRLNSWVNYLKGIIDGFSFDLSWTKHIPFSYLWILRRTIGNDVKTILDLGCGNGDLMKNIGRGENWEIVGVELFDKAVEKAKLSGIYKKVLKGDVTNLPAEIKNKKFDVVFSSQVLEHLPKHKGEIALKEWEKFARKRIVVSTTNGFIDYNPIEKKIDDHNVYQRHWSGWSSDEFYQKKYKVWGQGAKFIYGLNGIASKSPKHLLYYCMLSYLISPLVFYFPKISTYLIAQKEI